MKVLIIGGGLAGISIAHRLEERNISFQIIDKGVNHSTSIAAGMINPMTFRRMIKSWKADVFIPKLLDFYATIEKKIGGRFFYPDQSIRRLFSTEYERKLWIEHSQKKEYEKYMCPCQNEGALPSSFNDIFGSGLVNSPGYIEANDFVQLNQQYFKQKGKWTTTTFNFELLQPQKKQYNGNSYTHLIFAEGYKGEDNPYFDYLPFKNAKGELLVVQSKKLNRTEILNRKCFVLPTKDGNFKLGSTYAWNTKDPSPTESAKQEILERYRGLCSTPLKIIRHLSGIRPVAADRRPFIGEHPKIKGLYIFNGLGAKGFMIAPYFSEEFVAYLKAEKTLDPEVDIKRYSKRFFAK